jgi:predicted phosphate transport protein (TIGR00153 family)
MGFLGLSRSKTSSLKDIEELAGKIKQCAWSFQQALECLISKKCESFEELRQDVTRLAGEIQVIENQIRTGITSSTRLPVKGFQILQFIRELTRVTASVEEALEWFSFRKEPVLPQELEKDFFLLFDSVIDPIEELVKIVTEARKYFRKPSDKQRKTVVRLITGISTMKNESKKLEERVKRKIFAQVSDPVSVFHLVRLSEIIASICDKAENTGDLMLGMMCRA